MQQRKWKFQNRNAQTFGFVYHDTNGQKPGPVWKTQSFLLSEICMVILWQDCYGKGNLRKSYWSTFGKKFLTGNAYPYTVKKGYYYPFVWTISNWQVRQKTQNRFGKFSWKTLTWENQTSFLDHLYLGCTQRECKVRTEIVANYRDMFESRISAGAKGKPTHKSFREPDAETISSRSYDMEGHAKKCVERCCELSNKTTHKLYSRDTVHGWPSV